MKKIIFSLLFLISILSFSFADKTVILSPGWNVVSTPKILSWINFSNSWAWVSFYTLSWFSWISIIPTIQTIKPLEWFVVNNSTTWDILMSLIYKINVNPMEALFQKTLNIWRNILWITTTISPFSNIGSNATMSLDFTKNSSSNLLNWVNNNFTVNNSSSSISNWELWEAYGVFLSYSQAIYGGNQDANIESTNIINIANASADTTYTDSSNIIELGAFSVQNNYTWPDTKDILFQSITLNQLANADLANLSDIILERNSEVVAQNPIVNGRYLTFLLSDKVENASTGTYYIKAMVNTIDNSAWDIYQFSIRYTTDVNASEVTTNFISTVTLAWLTTPLVLHTYTVPGSVPTFARDTTLPLSMNYSPGSQVTLMKGTINTKSSITLEDVLALGYTGTYPTNDLSKMFSTIYLTIGNSTFSYSPTSGDTAATFLGSATVNGTAQVRMYATLKDTAPAGYVKFNDLKLSSFTLKTYSSNDNNITSAIGSIGGIQVTSQATTLNVTRTDGLSNTAISAGTNGLTVYGLRLSSTQGNGVTLSNLVLDITGNNVGTTGYNNNAYLTLYINGTPVQSKTVNSNTITFDGFSKTLNPTTPMDVVVKADFVDSFSEGTFKVTLTGLNAYDTLTSNAVTGYAKPAGAVFTIGTAVGTLAASSDAPLSKLFLSPSTTQKIGAFKVTATNDGVRLYDVAISGTKLDNLSNFKLVDTTGTVIATATTNDATNVVFSQMNSTPVIAKDTTATYYVVADVNSNTNTGGVAITVKAAWTNVKGSNGNTIAIAGSDVSNSTHAIADSTITIVQALNPNKEIGSSALRFTVTAQGKNSVILTGLTAYLATAGYSGNMVQVYKDSVTQTNLAFSGAYTNGATTLASYNAGKATIDVGTPVTYIMVFDSAIGNGTNATQSWTAKLTDANFAGYLASTYNNVATFPLTEVK